MIWLWTWLVLKKKIIKERLNLDWLLSFTFQFFAFQLARAGWDGSAVMADPHRDPQEPGAELSPWMDSLGNWGWSVGPDPGLLWVTPSRVEHQLLSPPPPPLNWGLMVIRSSVLSCLSHVGTIPIYHFEKWLVFQPLAHGFWLKNKERNPPHLTMWNI